MKLSITLSRSEKRLGWLYLVAHLLLLPVLAVAANDMLQLGLNDAELNFMLFAMELVLSIMIFRKFLWQSLKQFAGNLWYSLRFAALGLGLYYLSSVLLGLLTTYCFPDFSNANDTHIADLITEDRALLAVGLVFCVPVTEELLYRGVLFGQLQKNSRWLAYPVSALCFAAIHVVGYIDQMSLPMLLVSLVQYLPAGLILAWAYERTDSIFTNILIHMAVNQLAVKLM